PALGILTTDYSKFNSMVRPAGDGYQVGIRCRGREDRMTPQERALRVRQMGARHDWWSLRAEAPIAAEREIVDAHVHLWHERDFPDPAQPDRALRTSRYLLDALLGDLRGGHRVAQAVYV